MTAIDIDIKRLPKHIAIIMDGNGRWAKLRNQPRVFGHREGLHRRPCAYSFATLTTSGIGKRT